MLRCQTGGPQLDVVPIMFFINPCDLHKASPTKHVLSLLSAGFSFEGIFFYLLFYFSVVQSKREKGGFSNSAAIAKSEICLNKNTSKEPVYCSWMVCLVW